MNTVIIKKLPDENRQLAKGGWISGVQKSIKRRGTEGVCTGSKFGGPTCRPGTRRYALAQTFKKMARNRKKQEGGPLLNEPEIPTDNWLAVNNWMPVTGKTMELEFGDRDIPFSNNVNEFNDTLKSAYSEQSLLPYKMEGDKYYKNFPKSFQIGEGGEKTGSWRPFLNSQTGYPIDYDKKQKGGPVDNRLWYSQQPYSDYINYNDWSPNRGTLPFGKMNSLGLSNDGNLLKSTRQPDTSTLATMPTSSKPKNKIFGGGKGKFGMNDLMGVAPIIGSAIGAGRAFKEEPEEVKYQRAKYTPVSPALLDSTQQVEDVRGAFNTANLQMRQASPKDFLRRRTASATQEAGAIAGVRGGVQQANVGIRNRADELNARNRLYAEQMNTQIGMREQDANAANRAMDRSVEDMYLNQLFTQAGQYARDVKMDKANEAYNQRYLDIIEGEKDSLGGVGNENINAGNISTTQPISNTAENYSTDIAGQNFQTGMFADRQPGWFPGMDYNYNSNIRGIYPYNRFTPMSRTPRLRRPSIRLND